MLRVFELCYLLKLASAISSSKPIDGAFIIELAHNVEGDGIYPGRVDQHAEFHKRAAGLPFEYDVAHEYRSQGAFVGLSIRVTGHGSSDAASAQLVDIPGVISVSPVYEMFLSDPKFPDGIPIIGNPFQSYADPPSMPAISPKSDGNLASSLEMAGVDKLHQLGIKGKDVKVGIIDTGVDYRHPALGGGFGPGFKVAGGWAWLTDNGTAVESDDPLATCYGGGHGTHVAGIVGMDPLLEGSGTLNISGVAPEATLYMYRVFDCSTNGGSTDRVMAAMLRAQADGVDIISMSLSIRKSWLWDDKDRIYNIYKDKIS